MAKSNHLPVVLFVVVVFFCGYAGGSDVVVSNQWLVVREGESKNPEDKVQRTNNQQQTTTFQLLTTSNQQSTIKKIYDSQLGVREHGFNAGREVEEYLRYVNLGKGQPWCAAFICWVYGQADIPNPRSGWSPDLFKANYVIWNRGKEYQVSRIRYFSGPGPAHLTPDNPQPDTGDIFGIFFPEKGRIAHAGFIDRWDETWLVTVEGNTNLSGSPEGDGVYRKRRLVRSIYQVARYWPEQTSQ